MSPPPLSIPILLALASTIFAAQPGAWEVTGAVGLSASSGNSDTLAYHLQILGTYEVGKNEAEFGMDYFSARADGLETTNSFRTFGQYNRLVSERFYLGLTGEFLTDPIADVDYRYNFAAVAGYHLIKTNTTSLSFEVGPGYHWQQEGGISDSFPTLRFAQRFEHDFNEHTRLWQKITFGPRTSDYSDYLVRGEVGLDLRVNKNWSVRTTLRHQIDSTPAANRQKDDTTLLFGFAYALRGIEDPNKKGRKSLIEAPEPAEAAPMGWTTTASAGINFSSGNSDSSRYHLALASAYREEKNEAFYDLAYTFAEDNKVTSADRLRTAARYNRILDKRNFVGSSLNFLRDDLAEITYRITPALTAGRYFVKNDEVTFSLEAGPSYIFEEVAGIDDSYLSLIAAERLSWAINDRTTLKQEIVANISAENADNFTLVASAQLDTSVTNDLNWLVALEYLFDNQPATGQTEEDISLNTGVTVRF